MTQTRILLVHARPTRGGFTSVVREACALAARGDVRVGLVSEAGPRLAELPPTVDVELLPSPLRSLRGAWALNRIVYRWKPDVLHLHGRLAGAVGRIGVTRGGHRMILYTPHGPSWSGQSYLRRVLRDGGERVLLGRTDFVLCVSYSEMSDWLERDNSGRVIYLPNLLDTIDSPGSSRSHSRTDRDGRRVLVPTGYDPKKRLEVVVEALRHVRSEDVVVEVCGSEEDGDCRATIEALAIRLGVEDRLELRGNRTDILDALRRASLVVLPSYSEGMPIVGQQAIAVGARLAWSAIPPHIELFGDHGAPFWTASELATIIDGDHGRASLAGRRSWLEHHRNDTVRRHNDFWDGIVQRARMQRTNGPSA